MHAVDLRGFHPHQPAFQVLDLNEDSHQADELVYSRQRYQRHGRRDRARRERPETGVNSKNIAGRAAMLAFFRKATLMFSTLES